MRSHYDFSDAVKNPYIKKLKKTVTMKLDQDIISYFKAMSVEKNIPYQSLINLYLKDCTVHKKRVKVTWS